MARDLIVPIATAVLGVLGTLVLQAFSRRRDATERARVVLARNRDPLLAAAFDLQSRLYNIVVGRFLDVYLVRDGATASAAYAAHSTLWLVGQYLGWVEVLRNEVQFLDLGGIARNRRLQHCLAAVERELASDAEFLEGELRIFRADQRAIGEMMVTSASADEYKTHVRGYAAFVEGLEDPQFARWFGPLISDLSSLAEDSGPRLRARRVQRALIDLVDELDPERIRYPNANVRGRLALPLPERRHRRDAEAHLADFVAEPDIVDVWGTLEQWAGRRGLHLEVTDHARVARRRRRVMSRSLVVQVSTSDGWTTIDAWQERRRRRGEPVDQKLKGRRDLAAVNALLALYDRPAMATPRKRRFRIWSET